MNLLFRLGHELLFEWALGREIKSFKEILLTTFVYFSRVVRYLNSLFLFERKSLLDICRHFESSEDSLTSLFIQSFIMVSIRGVRFLRDWEVSFLAKLSVGFEHPCVAISHDRVAEARDVDTVPRPCEYQITH